MNDWETEFKAEFLKEIARAIRTFEKAMLELKKDPTDSVWVDKVFRVAHHIKSSAQVAGFVELAKFTNEFESILLKIRNKELVLNKPVLQLLLRCNDQLGRFVKALTENQQAQVDSKKLVAEIRIKLAGGLEEAVDRELSSEFTAAATLFLNVGSVSK